MYIIQIRIHLFTCMFISSYGALLFVFIIILINKMKLNTIYVFIIVCLQGIIIHTMIQIHGKCSYFIYNFITVCYFDLKWRTYSRISEF